MKSAATYFDLVLDAGVLLETIRVFVVVPQFGERTAELPELPLMSIACACRDLR